MVQIPVMVSEQNCWQFQYCTSQLTKRRFITRKCFRECDKTLCWAKICRATRHASSFVLKFTFHFQPSMWLFSTIPGNSFLIWPGAVQKV